MWEFRLKSVIRFCIVVFILTLVITIICLLMLKYSVEGENNMPFELSQLIVVSTAEGVDIEGDNTWNFDFMQNNDVYLYISKNKNYEDTEIIKRITLSNFKVENGPKKGNISIYRPSSAEDKMYEYNKEYLVDKELIYSGSELTNLNNLEIANQGGMLVFRLCNNQIRRIFIRWGDNSS